MQVSIIQKSNSTFDRVLPQIVHQGQTYIEAPSSGEYTIRLHNNTFRRRMVVVSVDGVNIISGADASVQGEGYVLSPWQTVDVPGFRRDDGTVAAFQFTEQGSSYVAQVGKGTQNVGVIGVAVYDEKVAYRVSAPKQSRHPNWFDGSTIPLTSQTWCSVTPVSDTQTFGETPTRGITRDVGTGYGREVSFHTTGTTFHRATEQPVVVLVLRYATRSRLESWGVPVDKPKEGPLSANPFPASQPSVPAPPGWGG